MHLEAGVLQHVDEVAEELVGVLLPAHAEVLVQALQVPIVRGWKWGGMMMAITIIS